MGDVGDTAAEEPRKRTRQRLPAPSAPNSGTPAIPAIDGQHATSDDTLPSLASEGRTSGRRAARKAPSSQLPTPGEAAIPADAPDAGKGASHRSLMPRRRAAVGRPHKRESNIVGLVERARLTTELKPILPLPDPLFVALPGMRRALLNRTLDEAAQLLTSELASALAPAVVQLWIADPMPWSSEQERVGGQELTPVFRARAQARVAASPASDQYNTPSGSLSSSPTHEALPTGSLANGSHSRLPAQANALIEEVVATRHPIMLFEADLHPLAGDWLELIPTPPRAAPAPPAASLTHYTAEPPPHPAPLLGTLAGYPLYARGQFLGVLAVGTNQRLGPRHLAALEDLCDLAALAADRDRLLSYSRSQEALAQTVVRQAPVAVAVLTGADHVFALSNPAFALLLGLEQSDNLTGQRLSDVLPPDRARSVAASLRLDAVYSSGEPQAMIELPIHHLERGMTYWNVTSSPLTSVSANTGGVLVAAVEVTRHVVSRQRAQESAEMAQERIGQMMTLHATSLAVAGQLGADPSELLADILRRSISLLDARAGTVYVRDPRYDELEVVVCQGLRGDYTGAHIRVGEGLAGRVGQTGNGLIVDDYRAYPFRAAIYDDEEFSAVIAVPLIQRGQVVGVLDVLDDAERRAFTDDDLWLLDLFAAQAAQAIENARTYVQLERAYRKQRDLDRMKDDFIATASHELRTPLTGVRGFLDLLLDYPGSRDEPLAQEFLQKASESAQELMEISERLLQTSRLDTGRMELHTGPVRLAMVVEEVLHSYKELQQAQGGHYDLIAEVTPDIYVHADLGRLKEVLDNLVGNAIKYSPHGGRIVVSCDLANFNPLIGNGDMQAENALAPRSIDERPTVVMPHVVADAGDVEDTPTAPLPAVVAAALEQPYFVIMVSDQGIGIPESERGHLFGRFSRLESARASQIRGTGLGLYICRQIMRAMDGDVWLQESAPGQGSTFACALPAAQPVTSGALMREPASAAGR